MFQQIEVDYYITRANEMFDTNRGQKEVPVVRMYGVNDNGELDGRGVDGRGGERMYGVNDNGAHGG